MRLRALGLVETSTINERGQFGKVLIAKGWLEVRSDRRQNSSLPIPPNVPPRTALGTGTNFDPFWEPDAETDGLTDLAAEFRMGMDPKLA